MGFGDSLIGLSERLLAERKQEAAIVEARRLLQALRSAGFTVTLSEDDLIRVNPRPTEDIAVRLRAAKPHLLTVLRAQVKA